MTDRTSIADVEALPLDEAFAVPVPADRLYTAAAALRAGGFTVHVADTAADARRMVNRLLPRDKTVFTSTSETLRESGLTEDIDDSGRFKSVRAQQAGWDMRARSDEVRQTRSAPDVVVGSVHAVTEDGRLVIASASGSQLAPYASGAREAVWVVGAQKIVADLDSAIRRIETYCLPMEDARAQRAYGQRSAISEILVIRREVMPGRATVVFVREAIGF
jgi:hypothetical protein